jgi:hypothetical protein
MSRSVADLGKVLDDRLRLAIEKDAFAANLPASQMAGQFLPVIAHVRRTYGDLSRAAYCVKYVLACRLFSRYVRVCGAGTAKEERRVTGTLLELVLENVNEHFLSLIDDAPSAGAERIGSAQNGAGELYRYRREIYDRALAPLEAEIAGHLVTVQQGRAHRVAPDRTYLYCITEGGDLVIYARPLSESALVAGVRHNGILVKHPLLAQAHNLTVRCAGDIWIAKDGFSRVAGLLASRASGQYRPSREALTAVRDVGRAFGLVEDRVRVIGE